MFGIGMLLPWNAILAAMSFFIQEFPDYQPSFGLLVAVSVPMLVFQAISFFFLQYIPLQARMTWTFLLNAFCTLLLVIVPLVVANEQKAYSIVIIMSVIYGSSYALLQATLYGVAGPCADLTNNLMIGLGISGLAINMIRIIFLATITNVSVSS